jgi:hypothetical protein
LAGIPLADVALRTVDQTIEVVRIERYEGSHLFAVTAWTLENLVGGNGNVSALDAHVTVVGSRTHQHEVIQLDTVGAAGNFDHWLAPWGRSFGRWQSMLLPEF